MNILITGGGGFIGYHLACYHIGLGDNVTLVDSLYKQEGEVDPEFEKLSQSPLVQVALLDMTKPIKLKLQHSIDIAYHLAAINGTRLFYERPYEVARNNLLLTLNLLDWLEEQGVRRLIYTSTSEVYAGAEQVGLLNIPTDETVPVVFPQPTDVRFSYGTSKFMGEFLCFEFGKLRNIPTTVIRYHNIYGPRMGSKHVIPEFIIRLNSKENPFRIYGGDETRSFCYIDDAVKATHMIAAEGKCDGEVIHVGNAGAETKIADLAQQMMALMQLDIPIREEGRRSGSVKRRCPDVSKLNLLTGFNARVSLKDGLVPTIDWYLAREKSVE